MSEPLGKHWCLVRMTWANEIVGDDECLNPLTRLRAPIVEKLTVLIDSSMPRPPPQYESAICYNV